MNRRLFLVSTGTVVTAVSGCLTRFSGTDVHSPTQNQTTTTTPDIDTGGQITEYRFTSEDFSHETHDIALLREGPRVTFATDASNVVVTGAMEVGSILCNEAALRTLAYAVESETLRTVITNGKSAAHPDNNLSNDGCDDAMSTDWYTLTVQFQTTLPTTVVVTERYEEDGEVSTRQTTAKASQ